MRNKQTLIAKLDRAEHYVWALFEGAEGRGLTPTRPETSAGGAR